MGSSGACASAAKTEDPCDAMVGNDSRVAEVSAAAVLRGEEGSRWRTSVLNLLSALVACAARTLAGAIRCAARDCVSVPADLVWSEGTESGGRGERRAQPGCGRRVAYKTVGAAGGKGEVTWTAVIGVVAAPWRRVRYGRVFGAVCRWPWSVEAWTKDTSVRILVSIISIRFL